MFMYPLALTLASAILLAYSLFLCAKMVPLVKWPYMRKQWRAAFYLICFFLLGCGLYAYALITEKTKFVLDNAVFSAYYFPAQYLYFLQSAQDTALSTGLRQAKQK